MKIKLPYCTPVCPAFHGAGNYAKDEGTSDLSFLPDIALPREAEECIL